MPACKTDVKPNMTMMMIQIFWKFMKLETFPFSFGILYQQLYPLGVPATQQLSPLFLLVSCFLFHI